jgi:hypothetical protein
VAASDITRSVKSRDIAPRYHLEGAGGANIKANMKIRGKAIPVQTWTGTEDSRRLRLPNFMTIDT